jgi:hypothetical protein
MSSAAGCPQEGELYRRSVLQETQRRLFATQLFRS